MGCPRGKASPNGHTKLRLFADSAGYCQNPDCNEILFHKEVGVEFHIAEMAHVFSAADDGPRSKLILTAEERGHYNNLILLCPICHTKIDKAPEVYTDEIILTWKKQHADRIDAVFKIKRYASRLEARNAILPLLTENHVIFQQYGPMTDHRFNPESEVPALWIKKIHYSLLPNNRKILKLVDANRELLIESEIVIVELYRQHVMDFENKHINGEQLSGARFPELFSEIFKN